MNWFGNQIIRLIQVRFAGKEVWVVWFVLVGSHSSELRIDHRLFFYIPDAFRKVMENFESISQRDELVWKTRAFGSFRLGLQERQFG